MTTAKCYIELRKSAARGTDSIIADAMRHLHTRQHLGKAIVISEQPVAALSVARKQWLKLSRTLQKQRASTLNADKILKYTHAITRMQHMLFSIKNPLEQPEGDVYFLRPDELSVVPIHCWSVYTISDVSQTAALGLIFQLPPEALIVDYNQSPLWQKAGVEPKKSLEANVAEEWQVVDGYLASLSINPKLLIVDEIHDVEAMDDALDTLLAGHSHQFLELATKFQRVLELARPLRLTKELRTSYDALVLLAHRVQALTPGAFQHQFLETYDENDTFFLYDRARRHALRGSETLIEAFARNTEAGRHNLARSLRLLAEATSSQPTS